MSNALGMATIFGPFLTIMGIWMLLYQDSLAKVWTAIKNTPALFYFCATFNLILGFAILSQYDKWMMDWNVLVTLLGWVLVVRGVLSLFVPQLIIKTMTHTGYIKWRGLIPFVWGILLSWMAFFM